MQVSDLIYPEQLVIWAARRWLGGKRGWERVQEEFALSLGCARARLALHGLESLLRLIENGARRTVFLHRLDCARVSADEEALLTLLGAIQARRFGQALALLDHLLPASEAAEARSHAELLAGALAESGRVLRPRASDVVTFH